MADAARRARRRAARERVKDLRFPWLAGNRFELLSDGDAFFPRMLEDIAAARRYVLLEMYLVESGHVVTRFIDALCDAAARGAQVCVLLDAFGSMGLARADRQRLSNGGVRLTHYNPLQYANFRRNLLRNHRKLLLIDGELAYTGGTGLTDAFAPADGAAPWHEVMLRVQGPVAADWHRLFALTWDRYADQPLGLRPPDVEDAVQGAWGRVTLSHRRQNQDLQRALIKRVRGARERIWIATAYFLPSWKLRRAWRRAARRGVDVRLLLPGPDTDHPAVRYAGHRFYPGLLRAGVRIYEYPERCLHAKIALCDGWCSIGSSNLDRWNTRWNLEANQEVRDAALLEALRAWFERDFAIAHEYRVPDWQARTRRERLLQWFWGKADLWLDWLSRVKARGGRGMRWPRHPWRSRRS